MKRFRLHNLLTFRLATVFRICAIFGFLFTFCMGCESNHWQLLKTEHIVLHYQPGTYAARNLESAAEEYGRLFLAAKAFVPFSGTYPIVHVYLHEHLSSWGYAIIEDNSVHYIYSEKRKLVSMHEMLHILLNKFNPDVPVMFEEGLCRSTESRTVNFNGKFQPVGLYRLAPWPLKQSWTLDYFYKNEYNGDDEGNLAAAFVYFCRQKLGHDRFWKFYSHLKKHNGVELMEQTFNQSAAQIRQEFSIFMDNRNP